MNPVRTVQLMLSDLTGTSIPVTGVYDTATREALDTLSGAQARAIESYLEALSKGARDASPSIITTEEVKALADRWVQEDSSGRYAKLLARLKGTLPDVLAQLVSVEAAKAGDGFDPNSVSPSGLHFGLTQMGGPAWADARGFDDRLPSHKDGRFIPYYSIGAAIAYMACQERYSRSSRPGYLGYLTFDLLYAAHNQGPSFWRKARNPDYPMGDRLVAAQSQRAIGIISDAASSLRAFA